MTPRLICFGLLIATLGCTTLQPVADYQEYVRTARPGRLWVTPRNSGTLLVEGPRFLNDTLAGFVAGVYREFAPGEVQQVHVREPATGRTLLLIGAAVSVLAAALASLVSGGPDTNIPTPEDPASSRVPSQP